MPATETLKTNATEAVPDDGGIRLNIGGGNSVEVFGFTVLDACNGTEIYPLPDYADNSVEEIRASHVLEHFPYAELEPVLKEWVRVLKPGACIRLAVPNFAYIAKAYNANGSDPRMLFSYTMGGQTDINDFHKSAFDENLLRSLMRSVGLKSIRCWESDVQDCARLPVSLNLQGVKSEPCDIVIPKGEQLVGCMSTSRLGFTDNLFCAMHVFIKRGHPLVKITGAFWGQCLERIMEDATNKGAEWIVTLDYDTVFGDWQFDEMSRLLASNPKVDAIAPWQCKREDSKPLVSFVGTNGEHRKSVALGELEEDLIDVNSAHFGLTFIRTSALQKMTHPWFIAEPNKDGRWGDGRMDDDINFWARFKEAGNRLCLASHVSIGHMQQVVTWPNTHLVPGFQYLSDYQREGPPVWARR